MREHNLTPAQVRDHARALILLGAREWKPKTIGETSALFGIDGEDYHEVTNAIADAIRTARITVDWDEEGT